MDNWKNALVHEFTPIREVIQSIETSGLQIALVVNDRDVLLGIITDGDIRRGLLKGISLDESAHKIMNKNPTVSRGFAGRDELLALMRYKKIRHIPVVDEEGRIVELEASDELKYKEDLANWVVLMAGGIGSRLQPLTNDCPKPLLKVGGKPILETILEGLKSYGFKRFYLSVNYKADLIERYFGNGEKWDVDIRYLREDKRLGTAGALSLLPELPEHPILVMNGDLLTKMNFKQLLDFHVEHGSAATMCVRDYEFQVPYGVAMVEKHKLLGISEKPIHHFFVNAGIYMINPESIRIIPKNTYFDMPSLFELLIQNKDETSVFPIREYWLDIGQMKEYERANLEFTELFNS